MPQLYTKNDRGSKDPLLSTHKEGTLRLCTICKSIPSHKRHYIICKQVNRVKQKTFSPTKIKENLENALNCSKCKMSKKLNSRSHNVITIIFCDECSKKYKYVKQTETCVFFY